MFCKGHRLHIYLPFIFSDRLPCKFIPVVIPNVFQMYHLICCFVFSSKLKPDHITAKFPTSLEGSIKQALFSERLSGAVFLLKKKKKTLEHGKIPKFWILQWLYVKSTKIKASWRWLKMLNVCWIISIHKSIKSPFLKWSCIFSAPSASRSQAQNAICH